MGQVTRIIVLQWHTPHALGKKGSFFLNHGDGSEDIEHTSFFCLTFNYSVQEYGKATVFANVLKTESN